MDNKDEQRCDVVVIGGGAAGLMCAIEAGRRGRSVKVLDHAERIGKKIGISGGGRCNFTNLGATADRYLSASPDFCKSALARYKPSDFVALVESHGIAYHEKKLGQLFCDFSSRQIIEMLLDECRAAGVELVLNCQVGALSKPDGFRVDSNRGTFRCGSLVIATGGLSVPKIGATDFGYRAAEQFGHRVLEPRPGLVPLLPGGEWEFAVLSGVSLDAAVSYGGARFRENILFTHRGLSGPAILQISSYWREGGAIEIDLLPDFDAPDWLLQNHSQRMELENLLAQKLPRRFVQAWCRRFAPSQPLNRQKAQRLREIGRLLNRWPLVMNASEGYATAEVTLGGVDTSEISSRTMESRKVPGLYFIGEVVDVTGWLGGYNFQWAWASGHAAGCAG